MLPYSLSIHPSLRRRTRVWSRKNSTLLQEYGDFLLRELPPLIRRTIPTMIDHQLVQSVQERIVVMVQELHQAFLQSRVTTQASTSPQTREPTLPSRLSTQQIILEAPTQGAAGSLLGAEAVFEVGDRTPGRAILSHADTEPNHLGRHL
jgi:hypothetical protein